MSAPIPRRWQDLKLLAEEQLHHYEPNPWPGHCLRAIEEIAALEAQNRQLRTITDEVVAIMATYHEQEKSAYGVDTPGGLEHMGDVWALLDKWAALAATELKETA